MASQDQYDPRIAMVSTWRPPLPKNFGKRSRWPRRLKIGGIVLAVVIVLALVGIYLVARDPRLHRYTRLADYHPPLVTRFFSTSGALTAEHVGARRTLLRKVPPQLQRAVIARIEPDFLTRPEPTLTDLGHAALDAFLGKPPPPTIAGTLAHELNPELAGAFGAVQRSIHARNLERGLGRTDLILLYLNQLPFGAGVFGAEEGARAQFDRGAAELDDAQAEALAQLAGDNTAPRAIAQKRFAAPDCGRLAQRQLEDRTPPEVMDRLGVAVQTSCDAALTQLAVESVQKHAPRAQSAFVLVQRLPEAEVQVLIGDPSVARAFGALRAPLVIATALESMRWTMASNVAEKGRLRTFASRAPGEAADALVAAGLNKTALREVAVGAGLSEASADALVAGPAELPPLEVATALSTLVSLGQRRQPQVLRTVGGQAEPEGARALMQAVSPEVAYLTSSLLTPPPELRTRFARAHGLGGASAKSAWLAAASLEALVLVWISGDEAQRASQAIGAELYAAATRGRTPRSLPRPERLVSRRVDETGRILPRSAPNGVEEWFLPNSVPREEVELAPEEPQRSGPDAGAR